MPALKISGDEQKEFSKILKSLSTSQIRQLLDDIVNDEALKKDINGIDLNNFILDISITDNAEPSKPQVIELIFVEKIGSKSIYIGLPSESVEALLKHLRQKKTEIEDREFDQARVYVDKLNDADLSDDARNQLMTALGVDDSEKSSFKKGSNFRLLKVRDSSDELHYYKVVYDASDRQDSQKVLLKISNIKNIAQLASGGQKQVDPDKLTEQEIREATKFVDSLNRADVISHRKDFLASMGLNDSVIAAIARNKLSLRVTENSASLVWEVGENLGSILVTHEAVKRYAQMKPAQPRVPRAAADGATASTMSAAPLFQTNMSGDRGEKLSSPGNVAKISAALGSDWMPEKNIDDQPTFKHVGGNEFSIDNYKMSTRDTDEVTFKAMIKAFRAVYANTCLPRVTTPKELEATWKKVLKEAGYSEDTVKKILGNSPAVAPTSTSGQSSPQSGSAPESDEPPSSRRP